MTELCVQKRLSIWIKQKIYTVVVSSILAIFFLIWLYHPDDLTVNLFSSSIFLWLTVMIVEKLLERTRLQRNEQSIAYVNGRIFSICYDLIHGLNPPKDLAQILSTKGKRREAYLATIKALKESTMGKLENVIMTYFHLVNPELRNDILNLANCLEILTYDHMYIDPTLLVLLRRQMVEDMLVIMWQSLSIMKKHNLQTHGRILKAKWKEGKPPEVTLIPTTPESRRTVLSELERIVNKMRTLYSSS